MNLIDKKAFKLFSEANTDIDTNELILTFNHDMKGELTESEKIVFETLEYYSYDNALNLTRLNSQFSSETNAKHFMERVESWENSVKDQIK